METITIEFHFKSGMNSSGGCHKTFNIGGRPETFNLGNSTLLSEIWAYEAECIRELTRVKPWRLDYYLVVDYPAEYGNPNRFANISEYDLHVYKMQRAAQNVVQ